MADNPDPDENSPAWPGMPDMTESGQPPGDFGGAFGYGHAAHKPDPEATYGFNPDQSRVLPVNPKKRWRIAK